MKKPEKVWMLIASTTVLLSCHINRAEALVFDWNVTGDQNFTGSGTITVAETGPVQYNTVYTIIAATGSISYNDGNGDVYGPDATITWPETGAPPIAQTLETDAQGDFLVPQSGGFGFDAADSQWNLYESVGNGYHEATLVASSASVPFSTIQTASLTEESAPVPFVVPGGASIPAVGTLLALGVMRKVRTFKKA